MIGISGIPNVLDIRFLITIIDLPFLILLLYHQKKLKALYSQRILILSTTIASVFVVGVGFRNHNEGHGLHTLLSNLTYGESDVIKYYGTICNVIAGFFLSDESSIIKSFNYGKDIVIDKKNNNKYNILIIQIESLDANIINQTFNGKKIAPYLSSLSKESVYYQYMLSFHGAGCSSDAEFSILNSIEPSLKYPSMKLRSYSYPNSIIHAIKTRYTCNAFHNNRAFFFNRNIAYAKMGFDNFFDMDKLGLEENGWGGTDSSLFENILQYENEIYKTTVVSG
jgi:phosphoglycerol transferase MdoB-like AlkP superfamily enzyme